MLRSAMVAVSLELDGQHDFIFSSGPMSGMVSFSSRLMPEATASSMG